MGGDGRPQLRHALARRVLVAPGRDRLGRDAGQLSRPVGVGEALAQVERVGGDGEFGHLGEDRGAVRLEPLDEIVPGPDRHAGDGTGALSSGRIVLTVANFNMHAGVDGWGRPFDHVDACRELDADVIALEEAWTDATGRPARPGRGDRLRARVPGGDLHAGRRPTGPPRPRGHRQLDAPIGFRASKNALFFDERAPAREPRPSPSPRYTEAERGSWGIAVLTRRACWSTASARSTCPSWPAERVRRAAIVVDLTVQGTADLGHRHPHVPPPIRVAPPLRPAEVTPARPRPVPTPSCWGT